MNKDIENIVKAPHYFLVHYRERHTSVNRSMDYGKCHTIFCDNVAVNVYGLSDKEAATFDPLQLRSQLIFLRDRSLLWNGNDEETVLEEIEQDKRFKDGVFILKRIENLPECNRMHVDEQATLYCGKPENEFNDGCFGGCVLQNYDQEEEMPDGPCPVQAYWKQKFELSK